MRWAGLVALMGEKGYAYRIWGGRQKQKDYLGEKIIL
jgi:hypothetical protein